MDHRKAEFFKNENFDDFKNFRSTLRDIIFGTSALRLSSFPEPLYCEISNIQRNKFFRPVLCVCLSVLSALVSRSLQECGRHMFDTNAWCCVWSYVIRSLTQLAVCYVRADQNLRY
jgi:hypothetical protein